jgi:hypothetical protein
MKKVWAGATLKRSRAILIAESAAQRQTPKSDSLSVFDARLQFVPRRPSQFMSLVPNSGALN